MRSITESQGYEFIFETGSGEKIDGGPEAVS